MARRNAPSAALASTAELWYVIRGDRTRDYPLDPTEFDGGQWWDLDPDRLPATDPHLPRFILKLDDCQRGAAVTTA